MFSICDYTRSSHLQDVALHVTGLPCHIQDVTYLVYPRIDKVVCDTIRSDVGPTLQGMLLGSAVSSPPRLHHTS